MTEQDEIWANFRTFCEANPFMVFETLEIKQGVPQIGVICKRITEVTRARVSIKFSDPRK